MTAVLEPSLLGAGYAAGDARELGRRAEHVVPATDHEGGTPDVAEAVDGAPSVERLEHPFHAVGGEQGRIERVHQLSRIHGAKGVGGQSPIDVCDLAVTRRLPTHQLGDLGRWRRALQVIW